jgi:hypothetical protein
VGCDDERSRDGDVELIRADEMFHPKMKNADLFAMLSQATEVSSA